MEKESKIDSVKVGEMTEAVVYCIRNRARKPSEDSVVRAFPSTKTTELVPGHRCSLALWQAI